MCFHISLLTLGGNCRLPITSGPCEAYMPRWAYDPLREECVEFIYGGCEGNENNFMTREECQEICHGQSKLSRDKSQVTKLTWPVWYVFWEKYELIFWWCHTFAYHYIIDELNKISDTKVQNNDTDVQWFCLPSSRMNLWSNLDAIICKGNVRFPLKKIPRSQFSSKWLIKNW